MASVLKCDCSAGSSYVFKDGIDLFATPWWITYQIAMPASTATVLNGGSKNKSAEFHYLSDAANINTDNLLAKPEVAGTGPWDLWGFSAGAFFTGAFAVDTWLTVQIHWDGTTITVRDVTNAADLNSYTFGSTPAKIRLGGNVAWGLAGEVYYIKSAVIGSTAGGSDLFSDGFGGGDLSAWTSTSGDVSLVPDPFIVGDTNGRVLIAWDDGPLEPSPVWTRIDGGTNGFPDQFVSGYDIKVGRQTLISQTDTGTATVYINDHELGLFDDRNLSSPFQGKLSGRQIKLQLYDPVAATWEDQFGGLINNYSYTIDGSASDANGDPINASIQLECVDMFDYLNGFGLTPGLAGVVPPSGAEDGVYYAATAGPVHDRIVEILADASVDSTRYLVASGNTKVIAVKYDPGESALTALRDAADAEFPFIANIYVDRHGDFAFRGRYSRFNPDDVAAELGSDWDFTRWAVGDEKAIIDDINPRAQMRALSFARDRASIINVAMCWPQSLPAADMPNQVFADTSSITAYGQHSAPPMSDLLTADYAGPGTLTPGDGKQQCYLFAKLLVKNQAFPREALTSLQVKAIQPDDYRATATWAFITRSDISHIVNVGVGYPGGTGFAGTSPRDDYYIEGRSLTVRPLNPTHDYVEYNVEVSPAVWSMDTHNVFPDFAGGPTLSADFTVAE